VTGQTAMGCVAALAVLILGARAWTSIAPVRIEKPRPHRRRPRPFARRERPMTDLDVAAWCDGLARAVRTGASLATAVRECEAHPGVARVTAPVTVRLRRGQSLSEALRATSATSAGSASAIGLALTVLRSCAELGGPAASPLERVAATLRGRNGIREEQLAHSAQARMSARVMTMVPVGMLALLAGTDPNVRSAIGTRPGFAAVSVGAILNVTGWWWMQRIVGRPR
jgi:tight adherence protein B